MYIHSRKKIFVSGRIQSKNQILYELWNKGFIIGIRPHIVVGAALEVKVQEKSRKWESQTWTNLKSQTSPIKWEAVSLCSFCVSGPPPDVWLWVQGCCWSTRRTRRRAEDIKDKLKTNRPLVSITTSNHSDLQRIMAFVSLLFSKSCANSLFGQLESRLYREGNSGRCMSSLVNLTLHKWPKSIL